MSKDRLRILITGGEGDWAQSFKTLHDQAFEILCPGRAELDVSKLDSVVSFLRNKKFDVLINNAGTIHPKRILESDPELWVRDIEVNLLGTYYVSKYVLESNPNAKIINLSSAASLASYPDWSSYCSSKAAVNTLTKSLANDGFAVYSLCPGGFDSKFRDYFNLDNSNLMGLEKVTEEVLKTINGSYKPGDIVYFRHKEIVVY